MSITLTPEMLSKLDAATKEKVIALVGSSVSVPEKKRGPKKIADMTPEELEKHKETVAARALKRKQETTVVPAVPVPVAPSTPTSTAAKEVSAPVKPPKVKSTKGKVPPMASLDS